MELMDLIESVDLVEFISQYTELEQKGREWWGLTPFQEENTPSFSVFPDKNVFYCFSTGYGGNIIDFIRLYYNCSVYEAIQKLKKYCGVEGEELGQKQRLMATKVCKKYKSKPQNNKASTAKILPANYMDKYIDGVNLEAWINEGISKEVLQKYQVRYDPLCNRIIYPIKNIDGEIVNIGGRTLDPKWKEKSLRKYNYYQPWGTISVIYGLYENKQNIIQSRNLILFEGCKSVLLANTWGINNCGAILTSHLGKNQMMMLLGFCSKNRISLTFALDKEIDIRKDKHIVQLKKYLNIYYLWDKNNLLPDIKMAPVDMGEEVFRSLLDGRVHFT